jgi:hypothetical protein
MPVGIRLTICAETPPLDPDGQGADGGYFAARKIQSRGPGDNRFLIRGYGKAQRSRI